MADMHMQCYERNALQALEKCGEPAWRCSAPVPWPHRTPLRMTVSSPRVVGRMSSRSTCSRCGSRSSRLRPLWRERYAAYLLYRRTHSVEAAAAAAAEDVHAWLETSTARAVQPRPYRLPFYGPLCPRASVLTEPCWRWHNGRSACTAQSCGS